MLLSLVAWVRNGFGALATLLLGAALIAPALDLPGHAGWAGRLVTE